MSNHTRHIIIIGVLFVLFVQCQSPKLDIQSKKQTVAWEKIGPGGGGAIFIPTFSYQNTDHFLLRCDMTGSYLTKDGGGSYQQINFPNGAASYAYDPKDSNVIYIGSAFLNKSQDGGKTWKKVFPKSSEVISEQYSGDHAGFSITTVKGSLYDTLSGSIANVKVDPISSSHLYFSMGNFFFYSSDGGETWKRKDCGAHVAMIYTNNEALKNSVAVFTGNDKYVFDKSSEGFQKTALPSAMIPAFSFAGGMMLKNKHTIFYALHHDATQTIENEFGHSELWMLNDSAGQWHQVKEDILLNTAAGIKPSYSMVACAEFDAANAFLVANRYEEKKDSGMIYWYGALKTNDAGKKWQWVWQGGGGSGQYAVKDGKGVANLHDAWAEKAFGGEYIRLMDVGVAPSDGNIAIVTDWYRTMKTLDGGRTWNEIYSKQQQDSTFTSRGLDVTTAYGVHFDPFDSNHIAISYTDIGYHHSYNGGKSWTRSVTGVPSNWINTCYWVVFDPKVKNKLWSAWSGMHDFPRGKMTRNPAWKQMARGGICVSVDGGTTWKPSNAGMGFDSPVTSIVMDPASKPGNRVLYAAVYNKGVFKSVDDGKTWKLSNGGIGENTCAFKLTLASKDHLFLTVTPTPAYKDGKKGRSFYSGAVYKSSDGAVTWEQLKIGNGLLFPSGIECDPKNPDHVYLTCWADIDLADLIGGDLARSTGGNEKLRMPGGIFFSQDGGKAWRSIFDQKQYVYDVAIDPRHSGTIYCNTFNGAAYRSDDAGQTWKRIIGYDFHWGQRPVIDLNDPEKIYLTTFGSSVWHGIPVTE